MDYNKINKIDIDGNGNIVLQDTNGSNITVNYNDTAELNKLISLANEKILSEIQKIIANQTNTNQEFEQILKKYLGASADEKERENKQFPPSPDKYKIHKIRELINFAFTSTDLNAFCMDYFYEIYNQFEGQSKNVIISKLIDYAFKNFEMEKLLKSLNKEKEKQYIRFQPYY